MSMTKTQRKALVTNSMAGFVDDLLLQGVNFDRLCKRAAAEVARRVSNGERTDAKLATPGGIKAHIRYRASQSKWNVTSDNGVIAMSPSGKDIGDVLVSKSKAKPKPRKPATVESVTE